MATAKVMGCGGRYSYLAFCPCSVCLVHNIIRKSLEFVARESAISDKLSELRVEKERGN